MQVVADDAACLPQPPRHARPEVTAEEVEALPAFPEVDHPRLVRMQLQPQPAQDVPDRVQGLLGLAAADRHSTTKSSA